MFRTNHCGMPPFRRCVELFPIMMEGVVGSAAAANAKLMFADDTWMYDKVDSPMTEDLPSKPVSNKGVLRAWLGGYAPARPREGQGADAHSSRLGALGPGSTVGLGREPVWGGAKGQEGPLDR